MTNSYKLLTQRETLDNIVKSGLVYFACHPEEGASADELLMMVAYFESKEMYTECKELMDIYNENFNADGSFKEDSIEFILHDEEFCQCENPIIVEYTEDTCCAICHKPIK